MEPLPLTRIPTPSNSPKSSKKRRTSPDAPTTSAKKPKTDPGQGHSEKDNRRKRRRQEKQPVALDSGAVSEIAQNVLPSPASPLTPASPLPSASRLTESRQSLVPSQSDCPLDCSSAPPIHSSPVAMASPSHEQRAACTPLRKERVMPISHSESKVRLSSVSVSNGIQTHHSLSATIKHFLRALYPPSCAQSVLTCSTNPLHFLHAGTSLVTAALSTGSTPTSNLMDRKAEASSAKKRVHIAVR
jgi:hypothetical protein